MLKAGWSSLFLFVWIIGAFLGSTFEYHSTENASGSSYTTGVATFTYGSPNVTGAGTTWNNALMVNGVIQSDVDQVWYKIASVNSTTLLNLTAVYSNTGGVGHAYTMQVAPGWAGTGGGGYAQAPVTTLKYLLNVSNAMQRIELLGAIPFPVPNPEYFNTVFKVMTWRWSFLDGYEIFYWIFLVPIIAMGVLSMLILVYGVLTGNLSF